MSHATMPSQQQPFAPYPGQAPAPVRKNGLGTTALVTGIIAAVFSVIPLVGAFIAIPLAIIAILFGIFGMVRAFRGRASKGLPIAGTVLGTVAMIIAITMSVATAQAFDETAGGDSAVTSTGGDVAQTTTEAGIGDSITDGGLEFTVTNVSTGQTQIGDSDFGVSADGQFVIVDVTVTNVGSESAMFTDWEQYAFTANGDRFDADSEAGIYLDDSEAFLNSINPGNTVDGKLVFDMPENAEATSLELHGGMFSEGATINLN